MAHPMNPQQSTPSPNPTPVGVPDTSPSPATPGSLPPAPLSTTANPKKSKSSLKGFIILAVLLVGAVITILVINKSQVSDAVPVANSFIADLQAHNTAAAYKLTTLDFQKSYTEQQMAATVDAYKSIDQGTPTIIAKGDNKYSQVAIVYKISGSSTNYISLVLDDRASNHYSVLSFYVSSKKLNTFDQ